MKPLDKDQKKVLRHGRFSVEGPPGSGKSNTVEGYVVWQKKQGRNVLVLVRKRKEAQTLRERGVMAYTLQKHRYDAIGRPDIESPEDLRLLLVGVTEHERQKTAIVVDEAHNLSSEFFAVIESLWTGEDFVAFYDEHQCVMFWAGAVRDITDELSWRFGVHENIPLTWNYRSVPKIVTVLNTIVPRDMNPFKTGNGYFHIEQCASPRDELHYIYNTLLDGFEDVQILTRTNRRCKEISKFLKARGVTHSVYPSKEESGIIVQTIHTAQASEHATVLVTGVNQGTLPDFRGDDGEHNLFYVGCSRAIQNLLLSYYYMPSEYITKDLRSLSA